MKSFTYIINLKDKFTKKISQIGNASQKVHSKLIGNNNVFSRSNDKVVRSIASIKQNLDKLKQKRSISISTKDIRKTNVEIRKLEKELQRLENLPPSGFAGNLRKLKSAAGGLGGAVLGGMAGFKLFEGIAGVAKLGMDMEQTEVSFETMLGSMSKAKGMIEGLDKFANATPFQNDVLYENSKLLLNFGMAGEKVIPTLKMLGDVSGGNKQKLDSLSLAYAQVQSAGKLTGQDLLQMINAGFNPLNEIAKKSGKSMGELKKAMSKGQISAQMVEEAFKGATSKGGRFYKMMEKQSKTAAGKLSTLMGKLKQKGIAIGKALLPAINWIIDGGLRLIDNISSLVNWYRKYSETINVVVGAIVIAVGAYQTYLIVTRAVKAATLAWAAATKSLGLALSLNPVGLIIAGIALLVAAITYVIMKTEGWGKQWQHFKATFGALLDIMAANFMITWKFASKHFMNFIDDIVFGWKKAQNLMGVISDKELKKEKLRIADAKKARHVSLLLQKKKKLEAQKIIRDHNKWEIKWKSGKDNSFAKAKDKAKELFGLGNKTKDKVNTSTSNSSTISNNGIGEDLGNSITGGGKKQTNISVKVEKFLDSINVYSQNIDESVDNMQAKFEEMFLRVLNGANSMSNG